MFRFGVIFICFAMNMHKLMVAKPHMSSAAVQSAGLSLSSSLHSAFILLDAMPFHSVSLRLIIIITCRKQSFNMPPHANLNVCFHFLFALHIHCDRLAEL